MTSVVEEGLAIGDVAALYDPPPGWSVVNVAREHEVGDPRFPLEDGPGNDPLTLAGAAARVVALLEEGNRVLVTCNAGISRSTTVAALALAMRDGRSWEEALAYVLTRHRAGRPHRELAALAREILADRS